MPERRPSELECFVLGIVWQRGPVSAYGIRRHLQDSPSTQWSASAGAIYPLVRRLERAGLLRSAAARQGKRRSREYGVTERGLKVLRGWVGPPLAAEAVTVAYDPLRSRARFLGALSAAERRAWVAAAAEAMEEVARRVRAWDERYGRGEDPYSRILTRSGELDVRSRTAWLRELERMLGAS